MPKQTKKLKGICPVCGKKLLVGVLNRVDELADRALGFVPKNSVPFKSIIPLEEVIASTYGVGPGSKKVSTIYEDLIRQTTEFSALLDLSKDELAKITSLQVADAIIRVREKRVNIEAGYDGLFGKIEIYTQREREKIFNKPKQASLF